MWMASCGVVSGGRDESDDDRAHGAGLAIGWCISLARSCSKAGGSKTVIPVRERTDHFLETTTMNVRRIRNDYFNKNICIVTLLEPIEARVDREAQPVTSDVEFLRKLGKTKKRPTIYTTPIEADPHM